MSDTGAVALMVAAALGAASPRPVPVVLAGAVGLAAWRWRRPLALMVAVGAACSGLSFRSHAGLAPPAPRSIEERVTLVRDPVTFGAVTRAEARLGRRRVELWAAGPPGWRLGDLLAGERVVVIGRLGPLPQTAAARLGHRHLSGRVAVREVGAIGSAEPLSRAANGFRRLLVRGATSLSARDRALFGGFVLGDGRGQDPVTVDEFRASGLTHLLVVSGGNVAFVLALAAPLVRRGRLGSRLVWGLAVLVAFGVLTRWEPSVLRASAMAAVTMLAATLSRPVSTLRVLTLAVTALLLVDPLLVSSVGFRLSAAACAGIALVTPRVAAWSWLPPALAPTLSVTVGAQAGVAPILATTFGGLPLASLPANLLAIPAAGPLMVWGLLAGPVAGLLGAGPAALLHLPTRFLVGWVAAVARWTSALPLGRLGLLHVAAIAAAAAVGLAVPRMRRSAALVAIAALALPVAVTLTARPPLRRAPAEGIAVWRAGGATVVVLGRVTPGPVLTALRAESVRSVDVLVLTTRAGTTAALAVVERTRPRLVVAPAGTKLGGAVAPAAGSEMAVGGLILRFDRKATQLTVSVGTTGAARPESCRTRRALPRTFGSDRDYLDSCRKGRYL